MYFKDAGHRVLQTVKFNAEMTLNDDDHHYYHDDHHNQLSAIKLYCS